MTLGRADLNKHARTPPLQRRRDGVATRQAVYQITAAKVGEVEAKVNQLEQKVDAQNEKINEKIDRVLAILSSQR